MNIEIITIGRMGEAWLREAQSEYTKRLSRYCRISVIELREARLPGKASPADEEKVKSSEGEALLEAAAKRSKSAYIFALDMRGRQWASEKFAAHISKLSSGFTKGHAPSPAPRHERGGKSHIIFLIGGSLGLSEAVRQKADELLSLSEMTFPHQMARVVLLEQLYRAYKILSGETYHK